MTAILEKGPISRAAIARSTGLSKQTSSEIVRALEETGWIRETGLSKGRIGRSAVLYQVVPDSAYIIGVDLGGTKVTAAVADMTGSLVSEGTELTLPGGRPVIEQVAKLCRRVAAQAGADWQKVRLAVVGMPGVVDPETGYVQFAPNIPGVERLRVRELLTSGLGVEVIVENDVNLAVLGERWRGAGQGIDDLVFIALGTGVGQGIVYDGKLVRGANGAAGEIGYLPLGDEPFGAAAVTVGAFESAVGSRAIALRYRQLGGRSQTVREIFDRAESGERAALEVLDELASRLALGVAATSALLDPQKVILGGSIGGRAELVERVRTNLPRCMRRPPTVEASSLGRRAGIIGALALGLEELHESTHGSGLGNPAAPLATAATPDTGRAGT